MDTLKFNKILALIDSPNNHEALLAARKLKAMILEYGLPVNTSKTCTVPAPEKLAYFELFLFIRDHKQWLTPKEIDFYNEAIDVFQTQKSLHRNDQVSLHNLYLDLWARSHKDP